MTRARPGCAGALIRQYREERGLTQLKLAKRARMSRYTVSALERGRELPRDGTIELLAGALGLSPEERTALEAAAAGGSGHGRLDNLPLSPTPFVGREQEIADLCRLIEQRQVLTLTGAGGVGKTRLAVEATRRQVSLMRDGAWFAELAPLADPSLVPHTVAAALGIELEGSVGHTSALVDALRPLRLLLVLDNCEHLAEACAALVDALTRDCPYVRVVATSREPLGCPGETVWPVPPFGAPPGAEAASLSAGELFRYDAIRLFVDRATASLPAFSLTERNAWAVADICRRLDGLPLALELAAARVRGLAVEQIATRLDDRFRLLTSGRRTATRQQQTLRAAVDWSYDLLDAPERVLFDRLSVFAAGFTVSAVEAVCADKNEVHSSASAAPGAQAVIAPGIRGHRGCDTTGTTLIAAADTLDLLLRLVDKSLVHRDDAPPGSDEAPSRFHPSEGEDRYRLLETLREYGHERLAAAGEADDVHRRHLIYHLRCIELAAEGSDAVQEERLRQLESERENLRAALRWARDRADAESDGYVRDTLSRLVGRLTDRVIRLAVTPLIFELRRLGLPAYAEVERRLMEQPDPEALAAGADLCWFIGDHAAESTLRRRRLELLEAAGDTRAAARARVQYARVLVLQNRPQEGIALLDEVERTAAELGDDELRLDALLEQGHGYDHLADCPSGRQAYASALALLTRLQPALAEETYQEKRLVALRGSGNTAHNADDNPTCVANHAEALAIAQEYGHRHEEAMQWVNYADGQWGCGDYGAALQSYRRALHVSTTACYTLARGLASLGHGIVLWSVGRLPEAARSLEDGLEIARDVGNAWWIAYGLTYSGNVRASLGDLDGARRLSREAVACAQAGGVGYPLALSRMHALWQDETAAPGHPEHAPWIEAALREAQRLGLRGIEAYLRWVRLLHLMADPALPDAALAAELAEGVQVHRERAPLKGCWELIGRQVLRIGGERRPDIDLSAVEVLVHEVIRAKAETLPPEQRPAYRDSRQPWTSLR